MVALVGGIIAVFLGLVGFILWWRPFLELLQGGIPLMLVLGGALATYLGVEEVRDKYRGIQESVEEKPKEVEKLKEDTEKYKKEVEELKKQLEGLKK